MPGPKEWEWPGEAHAPALAGAARYAHKTVLRLLNQFFFFFLDTLTGWRDRSDCTGDHFYGSGTLPTAFKTWSPDQQPPPQGACRSEKQSLQPHLKPAESDCAAGGTTGASRGTPVWKCCRSYQVQQRTGSFWFWKAAGSSMWGKMSCAPARLGL